MKTNAVSYWSKRERNAIWSSRAALLKTDQLTGVTCCKCCGCCCCYGMVLKTRLLYSLIVLLLLQSLLMLLKLWLFVALVNSWGIVGDRRLWAMVIIRWQPGKDRTGRRWSALRKSCCATMKTWRAVTIPQCNTREWTEWVERVPTHR